MRKAVFMDRDGTLNEMILNEDHGYLDSPFRADHLKLKNYAKKFVENASSKGYSIFVVSNQPSVAKGTLSLTNLEHMTQLICKELNLSLGNVYYCTHLSEDNCACRKPKTGLIDQASKDHNINLKQSIIIGDGWNDVLAGKKAGLKKTILLGRKDRTELTNLLVEKNAIPDYFAKDLKEAMELFNKYCII